MKLLAIGFVFACSGLCWANGAYDGEVIVEKKRGLIRLHTGVSPASPYRCDMGEYSVELSLSQIANLDPDLSVIEAGLKRNAAQFIQENETAIVIGRGAVSAGGCLRWLVTTTRGAGAIPGAATCAAFGVVSAASTYLAPGPLLSSADLDLAENMLLFNVMRASRSLGNNQFIRIPTYAQIYQSLGMNLCLNNSLFCANHFGNLFHQNQGILLPPGKSALDYPRCDRARSLRVSGARELRIKLAPTP